MNSKLFRGLCLLGLIVITSLAAGCATSKSLNWERRVGQYTFDQAVIELGPPERSTKISDGRTVAEWLVYRGQFVRAYPYRPGFGSWSPSDQIFPDRYLRLTFSPEGRLESWKNVAK